MNVNPHLSENFDGESECERRILIERRYFDEVPDYSIAWDVNVDGVSAIYYDGPHFQGKSSKVFAFYGCPEVPAGVKVPGVVLVHGGGGTAFAEWVKLWVSNGYAAIAMDTCGNVPVDEITRVPVPGGGITTGPDFLHLDDPFEDQWPYYTQNAIARARTLLGSFSEIDSSRIGITGISWGGYLSCIAVALDPRYAFAAHIYGCGFLNDQSAWMDELAEPDKKAWSHFFDPSIYLSDTQTPILWVTGTNDTHYPIESVIRSYSLIKNASVTLSVTIDMQHGHPQGWAPPEIMAFADSHCLGKMPLARIIEKGTVNNRAWALYESTTSVVSAEFISAKRSGENWKDRGWISEPASLCEGTGRTEAEIPPDTQFYFFNLRDARGLIVSTPITSNS